MMLIYLCMKWGLTRAKANLQRSKNHFLELVPRWEPGVELRLLGLAMSDPWGSSAQKLAFLKKDFQFRILGFSQWA